MRDNEDPILSQVASNDAKGISLARHRAERELVETRESLRAVAARLRLALSVSHLGDWSWNPQRDEIDLSDRAAEILGFNERVVPRRAVADRIHEEDRPSVAIALRKAIAERTDLELEYRLTLPSGELRWLKIMACCTEDGTELIGVVQDVTESRRAHDALQQSERQFRQLADAMPQVVWASTPDGHLDYFNRRWYESTTAPEGQFGEEGWLPVVHPDDVQRCKDLWYRCIRTGEPYEIEYRYKTPSGDYRWHLARALPAYNDNGEIVRWFGSSTDIDDQKRTAERYREESRVLELLNRTGAAIGSTLDLQSLVQSITDASTEMSGAKFGAFFYNATGEHGEHMVLYTLSGAPREAFENLGKPRPTSLFGSTFRGEATIRVDDILADPRYGKNPPYNGLPPGHLPVRSYLAVPVVSRSGRVHGGLFFGHPQPGMFSERSERLVVGVAAQAALAIDNAELYEDVRRAAVEREALLLAERAAREEAEKVSRMKDEFLATLSHELRTPLTAILGWAQVLKAGVTDPDKIQNAVETIARNARAQTQLVEDLLDMNRIVSGKIRLNARSVNVAETVNAAVESVRLSAEVKGIQLNASIDSGVSTISGDAARLQQVFWNLLSNAVKFTPHGGRVDLSLGRADSHIEVSVRDTGPGIDDGFLPHIFDRFRQADASSTRSHGGLGLGLSIAKNLVELHGGTIQARNAGKEAGAVFVVRLPIPAMQLGPDKQAAAGVTDINLEDDSLTGVRVLVVEDDADARELIKSMLNRYGAEVSTANSADQALEVLDRSQPHVIVSDIGMPGKDGYQLMREIRQRSAEASGNVPALALTAFARPEDGAKAMAAGFQAHASKPVEPQELVSVVARLAGCPAAGDN